MASNLNAGKDAFNLTKTCDSTHSKVLSLLGPVYFKEHTAKIRNGQLGKSYCWSRT